MNLPASAGQSFSFTKATDLRWLHPSKLATNSIRPTIPGGSEHGTAGVTMCRTTYQLGPELRGCTDTMVPEQKDDDFSSQPVCNNLETAQSGRKLFKEN